MKVQLAKIGHDAGCKAAGFTVRLYDQMQPYMKTFWEAAADAIMVNVDHVAACRLLTIKDMSAYLDRVSEALDVPLPTTPHEGEGACWLILEEIAALKKERDGLRAELTFAHGVVEKERQLIREASEYLDTNKLTNIAHGSLLHQAFKGAVAGQPALWCVHVEGPDDILAMPTKDCAERVALKLNKGFDALNGDDLHIQAKVVPYPYSKEGFDKAMDTWADMVAEDWG